MADAKICDICGHFYDHELQKLKGADDYKKAVIAGRQIMSIELYASGISRRYDLCPKCSDKLRDCLGREVTKLN